MKSHRKKDFMRRFARRGVVSLLLSLIMYIIFWMPAVPTLYNPYSTPSPNMTEAASLDELETALASASMENKTLIITVLNKAYAEENGMFDVFFQSLKQGEDTEHLIKHILFMAVDQISFDRCKLLNLNCYLFNLDGVDLSEEKPYKSEGQVKMMWLKIHFAREVLKRGYDIIFTDMDILWLRNPFTQLSSEGDDMQISCDFYNGNPYGHMNSMNTGFYFVASNDRTIALFDAWYEQGTKSNGLNDQDMMIRMRWDGAFTKLDLKIRYLDTLYFYGFCRHSADLDFSQVITIHANCCRTLKAKLTDLSNLLAVWGSFDGNTTTIKWSGHRACSDTIKAKKDIV